MSSDAPPLFIMNQYEPYFGYDSTNVNYQVIVDSTYSNIDSIINITDPVIIDLDLVLWIMSDSIILDPQYDSIINSLDSLIFMSDSLMVDSFKLRDTLLLNQYDLTTYYNNSYGDSTSVTFNFPYNSDILIGTDSTEYDYDITMIGYAPLVMVIIVIRLFKVLLKYMHVLRLIFQYLILLVALHFKFNLKI